MLQYSSLASALPSILHSEEMPMPTFTELSKIDDEDLGLFSDSSQTNENLDLDSTLEFFV